MGGMLARRLFRHGIMMDGKPVIAPYRQQHISIFTSLTIMPIIAKHGIITKYIDARLSLIVRQGLSCRYNNISTQNVASTPHRF